MTDSNALILEAAQRIQDQTDAPKGKIPKLSKFQLRKQKKVQEEQIKRQQRAEVCNHFTGTASTMLLGFVLSLCDGSCQRLNCKVQVYTTLQQHALSETQHALMMPAHMLGQSESKRQQLRRAMHHQQAGLALPEGSQLERERHVQAAELDPLSASQVHLMAQASTS